MFPGSLIGLIQSYLQGPALHLVRVSIWLALLTAVLSPLEKLLAVNRHDFFRKGFATDVAYYFLNSFLPSLLLSAPLAILAWGVHHLVPAQLIAFIGGLPLLVRVCA